MPRVPNIALDEIDGRAKEFLDLLKSPPNRGTLVTLSGELGAGKTTFVQAMARALGVEETVTSPTFVIQKIYELEGQPLDSARGKKFSHLIHIDAYRLKSAHELEMLGWKELCADPANLILIEWPKNVASLIPDDAIRIRFDIHGDERTISINGEEKE